MPLGKLAGAVSEKRWSAFTTVRDEMTRIIDMLQGYTLSPQASHTKFPLMQLIIVHLSTRGGLQKGLTCIETEFTDRAYRRQFLLLLMNWYCIRAFDMLRYPHISTRDLKVVFPELADVDPAILERIDIEGMLAAHSFGRHSP